MSFRGYLELIHTEWFSVDFSPETCIGGYSHEDDHHDDHHAGHDDHDDHPGDDHGRQGEVRMDHRAGHRGPGGSYPPRHALVRSMHKSLAWQHAHRPPGCRDATSFFGRQNGQRPPVFGTLGATGHGTGVRQRPRLRLPNSTVSLGHEPLRKPLQGGEKLSF